MIHENGQIHEQWHQGWAAKEAAIRSRLISNCEKLEANSRELEPLREGDSVFIQNQDPATKRSKKWDRQGSIVATGDNDQYLVRIAGTGRLTLRNRRFLRKFQERLQSTNLEASAPMLRLNVEPGHQQRLNACTPAKQAQPTQMPDVTPELYAPAGVPASDMTAGGSPLCVPSDADGSDAGGSPLCVPSDADGTDAAGSPLRVPSDAEGTIQCGPPQPHIAGARGRGRPRKQLTFNFSTRRTSPVTDAQQQSSSHADGCQRDNQRCPDESPQQQEMAVRQSHRVRMQRKVYDANTGNFLNPSGT